MVVTFFCLVISLVGKKSTIGNDHGIHQRNNSSLKPLARHPPHQHLLQVNHATRHVKQRQVTRSNLHVIYIHVLINILLAFTYQNAQPIPAFPQPLMAPPPAPIFHQPREYDGGIYNIIVCINRERYG